MKKLSDKYLIIFIIIAVVHTGAGCGKSGSREKVKVGILKFVSHQALDEIEKGIQDELEEEGFSNIIYDIQNANGEITSAGSIAQRFRTEQVKMAVGIAAPSAKALKNALKDTVVVFSAVTDPVQAGLVRSLKTGEKKVAGISDMIPVREQIEYLKKLKDIKKLGHIYSGHDAGSAALAKMVRRACYALDMELVEVAVKNPAEVKDALKKIAVKIDALYLGTDSVVISEISAVAEIAEMHKLPVMSADTVSAGKSDILAAWGFDYYKMGINTGKLIARILSGERPENIPVIMMDDPSDADLLLNLDVAKKLGITIPEKIISQAGSIIEDGKLEKR